MLRPDDIPHVQLANITNLPENYFCKYYLYHAMSWPQLSYVAVDVSVLRFVDVLGVCWRAVRRGMRDGRAWRKSWDVSLGRESGMDGTRDLSKHHPLLPPQALLNPLIPNSPRETNLRTSSFRQNS